MYKQALVDATDMAFKELPTADIAKSTHLPEFVLRGIVNGVKTKLLVLSEEEAEKILNGFFSIVDAFREKLTKKAITAIESGSDDKPATDETP